VKTLHLNSASSQQKLTWMNNQNIHYIDIAGVTLRYLKMGQGKPLMLIHTLRTQRDYFSKIIPELAKHYTVYALDLAGYGYSDIINQVHNKALFVHHVSELIIKLKLEDLTLVGESIGALISLALAAEEKTSVKRVVALNPADYVNSNGLDRSSILGKVLFSAIRLPLVGVIITNAENRFILRKVLEGGFENRRHLPIELVKEFSQVGKRAGYTKAFRSVFLNWRSWQEGQVKYLNIKVPVTLVYAENDWSLVSERQNLNVVIEGSELITINECGHFSSLEKPQKVITAIFNSELNHADITAKNGE
jgi:pimeloyl-ACP methyl ester carboxylesterase